METAKPGKKEPITVTGSFFFPEMRTVVNMLEICDIDFNVQEDPDVLTEKGQNEYIVYNPARTMPALQVGAQKIFGDLPSLVRYIAFTNTSCREQLYPTGTTPSDVEERQKIDSFLEMVQAMLKSTSTKLLQLTLMKHDANADMDLVSQQLDMEKQLIFEVMLKKLERIIDFNDYCCGPKLTVADLAVFHELQNILHLLELKAFDRDLFPSLCGWKHRVSKHDFVQEAVNKMQAQQL